MLRIIRLGAAMASAMGLAACLVPEKFETSVRFQPDGGYVYRYDGTAAHLLAVAAIKEKGSLPAKDEDGLKREAEKAMKSPAVKKMAYTGRGRYEVHIEETVQPGQQVRTLKIFNVRWDKDGTIVMSVPPTKDKDREQLRSFEIRMDGKAEVFLPSNAKVLEHNASGTPGLLSKAYTWKIGATEVPPMLRFALSP